MDKIKWFESLNLLNLKKNRWTMLSFLLFSWVAGGLILYSVNRSNQKNQMASKAALVRTLIVTQLQFLQTELGQHLAEELAHKSSAMTGKDFPLHSSSRKFIGVGLVEQNRGLEIKNFFKGSDPNLTAEFIQKQLNWLSPTGEPARQQGYFWVDEAGGHSEYLFSLLPFEMDGQKTAWGIGVSQLPTSWLDFNGASSLFLIEKQTGRIISAFGGENQGGKEEIELAEAYSSRKALLEADSQSVKVWQEVPGTNLILLLHESGFSIFPKIAVWGFLSFAFLAGVVLLSSPSLKKSLKKEETLSLENDLERERQPSPSSPVTPAIKTGKKQVVESSVSPAPPVQTPVAPLTAAPVESLVEDQLLETVFAKDSRGHRVLDAVSEVVEYLAREIQGAGVRVNVLVSEHVFSQWPQTQLKTVLEELVKNSVEAMDGCDTKTLTFTAESKGQMVELVVEDTGHGMTDEVLARSLQAFFSTKPTLNKRRGLGLNVAKRLLEISGGSLRIESTPAIGTKVFISFPKEIHERKDDFLSENEVFG